MLSVDSSNFLSFLGHFILGPLSNDNFGPVALMLAPPLGAVGQYSLLFVIQNREPQNIEAFNYQPLILRLWFPAQLSEIKLLCFRTSDLSVQLNNVE